MATLKEITHDSSTTLSDFYSSITDPDGAITVTPGAALGGSVNGLSINNDAGASSFEIGTNFVTSTPSGARYRIRVNLDGLTNGSSSSAVLAFIEVIGFDVIPDSRIGYQISGDGGTGFEVECFFRDDVGPGSTFRIVGPIALPSGDVCLDADVTRETADGNNDGTGEFFINGVSQGSFNDIENFNDFDFDGILLSFSSPAAISGTYKCDEFILTNVSGTGLCAAALSLAPMTRPASVDASGEFIYLALLESGVPILTKISTALDADGNTAFDPGAGDDIGVQCSNSNANVIWIAGAFDGTNKVEKSEDGGSSFTVKDDGTIGDVEAFVVGPDSDKRVLIFDETNNDILETIDDGENWTTINASVTPIINAIARLDTNVQETVFGNESAANDNINYTVNSGDDLEDYQTGVFPTEDVTTVIVN